MNPDEYQRIQDLFLQLREMEFATQATKLAAIAESDADRADLLRKLLAADKEQDFLEKSNHPTQDLDKGEPSETKTHYRDSESAATHPKKIGPYRILQQIGEGGHGIVYMAEQTEPIRRRVAIKCIKPGMASKAILARFEAERQALAMMSHPSIANVIDADSTDSGQPYFVLELVHGVPIDQFCTENELTLEQRLQLFRQTCEAVHHAHRKGIIHRDIKPANVLVTVDSGKPLAKVIDFGIAKALHMPLTEKTMFTEYGQIVGTLEYMSPEQAMMSQTGADVRSDVYSLGVLLYLLLTGKTPISKDQLLRDGLWELRNVLCNFQPQTPSLRLSKTEQAEKWKDHATARPWIKSIHGDLDWITMKALAKEPELRYDSAAELAADVANFMNRDPVLARPPSLSYSLKKWVRKNRVAALISFALLASIAIAMIGLVWGYFQSRQNLDIAVTSQNVARERAEQLRVSLEETKAERNRADAAAARLAKTLKRSILESAWKTAMNGDGRRVEETLVDIPRDQRSALWDFVKSVGQQMDSPSLRDEHQGAIRTSAINDASQTMAVITTQAMLEIWDLKKRAKTEEFELEKGIYTTLSFNTEGSKILVGKDGRVQLIELANRKSSQPLSLRKGGIRSIAHCQSLDRWFITTGANHLIAVDANTDRVVEEYRLPQRIGLGSVSPDGSQVAIAGLGGDAYLFESSQLQRPLTIRGNAPCIDFAWTDQDLVATTTSGKLLRVRREPDSNVTNKSNVPNNWIAETNNWNRSSTSRFTHSTLADANSLILANQNAVVFGDATQNQIIPIQEFEQAISEISWLPSTGDCVVQHLNGRINLIPQATIQSRRNYVTGLGDVSDGACLSDSRKSITAHQTGALKRWNTTTGELENTVQRHSAEIMSLSIHEDQQVIATMGSDWKICLTHLDKFKPIASLPVGLGVRSVIFSTDGSRLAGGPDRSDSAPQQEGTIDIWDVNRRVAINRLKGHNNWVIGIQFFDNDQRLASLALDGTVKIWNVEEGRCLTTVDFSNFANGNVIQVIEGTDLLLVGHADGSITSWDIESGHLLKAQSLLGSQVTGMVRSPDGKSVLLAAENHTKLTCIDVNTLAMIAEFDPGVGAIVDLRTDLASKRLQVFGSRGTIRNWKFQ